MQLQLFGRGFTLQLAITVACEMAFILFGYDQGVFSGIVGNQNFLDVIGHPGAGLLGIIVSIYNLGCFSGCILTFCFADYFGRRRAMWIAMVWIIVGAPLQCSSYSVAQVMVGRFVTGIGTGIETSTVPMYQSELSHAHQRGRLVCSEALFVGVGIVIAYWFDYGMNFVGGAIAWRLPVGFQIIFTFVVIFLVFGLPESPRYLYNQGRAKEGLQVLCDVYNKEPEHPEIVKEQQDILDAIEMEAHRGKSWLELFKPDRVQTRKRILLAYGMQFMNQVGGINLVVYFVPTVLQENVGLTRNLSLLLGGVINCMFVIGSFVPALLVDRIGRRQPMMWGSLGLGISMMMIAVLLSFKGSANEHATSSASVAFFFTEQTPAQSGPYPPATQSLGGLPTIGVDVPITSVFLVLFVVGAVGHMTIFQLNIRAKRKFIPSAMLFGLCLIRTISCALRMGWATHPRSINVAIAANVFVYAGTIILYLINILFAQRIVRATHPSIGWSQAFTSVVILIMALIVVTLIMVVTVTIQSIFTLSIHTHHIDRSIQLYGSTFNVVIAFLPFLVTIISLAIPRRSKHDHFGSGSSSAKMLILLGSSGLITLGAGFRAGTSWSPPTPLTSPSPWYLSKACFYIFNFTVEILIIYSYLVLRVDKRFIIRNGAKGPGSYSLNGTTIEDAGDSDNVESSSTTEQEKTPEDSDGLRRLMSTGESKPPSTRGNSSPTSPTTPPTPTSPARNSGRGSRHWKLNRPVSGVSALSGMTVREDV